MRLQEFDDGVHPAIVAQVVARDPVPKLRGGGGTLTERPVERPSGERDDRAESSGSVDH